MILWYLYLYDMLLILGQILKMSMEELSDLFQGGLEKDFGYDDDQVIESLRASMEELHRSRLDLPPPAVDNSELPTKPFGQFVQPSMEKLIGRRLSDTDTGFMSGIGNNNRPVIPADGGPVVAFGPRAKRLSDGSGLSSSRQSELTDNFDTATEGGFSKLSAKDYRSSQTSFLDNFLDVESVVTSVHDRSGSINTLNDEDQMESMDFDAETSDLTWDEGNFHDFLPGNRGDTLVPSVHGAPWNQEGDSEKEKVSSVGDRRSDIETARRNFLYGTGFQNDTKWKEAKSGESSSRKPMESVGKDLVVYNQKVSVISVSESGTVIENLKPASTSKPPFQSTIVTLTADDRAPVIQHTPVSPMIINEFFSPSNRERSPITPTQELYNGSDFGVQQPKTSKASKIPLVAAGHFRPRPDRRYNDSYEKNYAAELQRPSNKAPSSAGGSKVSVSSSGFSSISNPKSFEIPFGGRHRGSTAASDISVASRQSSRSGSVASSHVPLSSKVVSQTGQVGSRLVLPVMSSSQSYQKPKAPAKNVRTVRI